jgi:hypothetical protein
MVGQGGRRCRPPEETAYVLDPKAVYDDNFPGETFRVPDDMPGARGSAIIPP